MSNTPSHEQNAQLYKLWLRSKWADGTAIKELQNYYTPKLTAIAFRHLEDPNRVKEIVEEVFLDMLQLDFTRECVPDVAILMMQDLIQRCKRERRENAGNDS